MGNESSHILSGSNYVKKRVVEEKTPPVTINLEKSIQSLVDAQVTYTGRISGRQYTWNKAGAIVKVDEQDVPELLAKRRGKKPCCGEQERQKVFQLVD